MTHFLSRIFSSPLLADQRPGRRHDIDFSAIVWIIWIFCGNFSKLPLEQQNGNFAIIIENFQSNIVFFFNLVVWIFGAQVNDERFAYLQITIASSLLAAVDVLSQALESTVDCQMI